MSRRYLLSRPRTKMYDYNYTMGERLYKPTIDSLDRRSTGSSISESARAAAEATAASIFSPPPPRSPRCRSVDELSENDEVSQTIRKIRASRAAMEEETRAMEEQHQQRRAARGNGKVDVTERLMDSIGLKSTNGTIDEIAVRKPRRAISEIEEDPFFKKRTFALSNTEDADVGVKSVQRWTKLEKQGFNGLAKETSSFDEAAAANRAKQSRARIAEIENEMEEVAERAKARTARRAAAEAVLAEAADMDSSSSSVVSKSVRIKRTTAVTSEKRSAY